MFSILRGWLISNSLSRYCSAPIDRSRGDLEAIWRTLEYHAEGKTPICNWWGNKWQHSLNTEIILFTKLKITEAHNDTVEPKVSEQLDILLGGACDGIKLLYHLERITSWLHHWHKYYCTAAALTVAITGRSRPKLKELDVAWEK